MVAINAIALGAFSIPRHDSSSRLGVSVTMVLTVVAFKLEISSSLPDLSYLTLLDKFVLISFMYVGAIAMENGLATYWLDDAQDEAAMYLFIAFFFLWSLFVLAVIFLKTTALSKMRGSHDGTYSITHDVSTRNHHIEKAFAHIEKEGPGAPLLQN